MVHVTFAVQKFDMFFMCNTRTGSQYLLEPFVAMTLQVHN